jgi:hypothetical protein
MTLISRIGQFLGYEPRTDSADDAMELAKQVTTRIKSLEKQLKPISLEHDPFAAIVIRRRLAEKHLEFGGDDDAPANPSH